MGVVLADVGAVLAELGIPARKKGEDEWFAKCPSHSPDRNPSWSIIDDPSSPKHGLHQCRSCGFRGTLALLVMHVRGFAAWGSAYELLERFPAASRALPRVRVAQVEHRGFRAPSEVIWEPLSKWGSSAKRYAVQRGLTEQQVARWGIGYAVDGRLAGRIVFPVHDAAGRLCSYQARLIPGLGDGPRYLTPREEDRPDQDAVLGERYWRAGDRRSMRVVVWEGAIKGLAFERAVPGEAFADLGGSKIRAAHAGKLAGFGEVVIASDGDRAGVELAEKLAVILGRHSIVKRAILPSDPDEMTPEEVERFF